MGRPVLYLLAAVTMMASGHAIWEFYKSLERPIPRFDLPVTALWFMAIAVVCVIYDVRRTRRLRQGFDPRSPVRWRDKPELRFLLYCFATMIILEVPSDILKAEVWIHREPPPFRQSLWSQISMANLIVPPIVAAAAIFYDQRRLRREAREDGLCSACGYNLRGNVSGVCPECGTPVPSKAEVTD